MGQLQRKISNISKIWCKMSFTELRLACSANGCFLKSLQTILTRKMRRIFLSHYIHTRYSNPLIYVTDLSGVTIKRLKLVLHDVICLTDSFMLIPSHYLTFKMMRYESENLNRILADKLHRVTLALFHLGILMVTGSQFKLRADTSGLAHE